MPQAGRNHQLSNVFIFSFFTTDRTMIWEHALRRFQERTTLVNCRTMVPQLRCVIEIDGNLSFVSTPRLCLLISIDGESSTDKPSADPSSEKCDEFFLKNMLRNQRGAATLGPQQRGSGSESHQKPKRTTKTGTEAHAEITGLSHEQVKRSKKEFYQKRFGRTRMTHALNM